MIKLIELNENNYFENVVKLKVRDEQRKFLDSPTGIVARGFVYRKQNPKLFVIKRDNDIVGLIFLRDLVEEPACYDFQQILVDARYQYQGIGKEAVKMVIEILKKEKRFNRVDVSINKDNLSSLSIFKYNGFKDTGYICEDCKENINLSYSLD